MSNTIKAIPLEGGHTNGRWLHCKLESLGISGNDLWTAAISIQNKLNLDRQRRKNEFYKDDGRVTLGIGDMLPGNGLIERVEQVIDIIEELTA